MNMQRWGAGTPGAGFRRAGGCYCAGVTRRTWLGAPGVHPPLEPARGDDALYRHIGDEGHVHRAATVPAGPEPVALTGPLSRRDQGELQWRGVHLAAGRRVGRVEGGRCLVLGVSLYRWLARPLVPTGQLPPDLVRGLVALAKNWRQGDADPDEQARRRA